MIINMTDEAESFNDLLAIARLRWLHRLRVALAERGFDDFRRGDGAWVRILGEQPSALGEIAEIIGVSPQAVTKMADSLERRGYVERRDDDADRRRVVLHLTDRGRSYQEAVVEVVANLDDTFRASVPPADLEAAFRVLHIAIGDGDVAGGDNPD
jgi:MarR family transcriptional regulator, transcriptional regulator for hemolysin